MTRSQRQKLIEIGMKDEEIDKLLAIEKKDMELRRKHASTNKRIKQLPYFPFELTQTVEGMMIVFGSSEMDVYIDLLNKYNLTGNGHCWAEIIKHAITTNRKDPNSRIRYDSNSDSSILLIAADELGREVAKWLYELFTDKSRLKNLFAALKTNSLDC